MNNTVDTINYKGYEIEIIQDIDPLNPIEDWDCWIGTMCCSHSRYTLGHKQFKSGKRMIYDLLVDEFNYDLDTYSYEFDGDCELDYDYENMSEIDFITKWQQVMKKQAIVLPLYLYDHSGITINTTGFSCPWDSGQVGFIYANIAKVKKEYEWKLLTQKRKEQVIEWLKGEVETYDQFLTGDVYGFNIDDPITDEHIDSCWGFFGDDWEKNGLFEHSKPAIDYHVKKVEKEKAEAYAIEIGDCVI